MKKKSLLLIAILIVGFGIGALSHNWIVGKQQAKSKPPSQVKQNPGTIDSKSKPVPAKILPILGNSNRLSAKEWQNMLSWRQMAVKLAIKNQGLLYINGPTQNKKVALTFDDGPDATITPQVLKILQDYNAPATFFIKGNQALKYRSLIRKIYAQDCVVESHAYSHQELSKMSRQDIDRELTATDQVMEKVIGKKPGLIRPPYGDVNNDVLAAAQDNGQRVILWSIDTLDWSQQEPQHITDNVLKNVRFGDIILMHSREGQEATAQALPAIIKGLRQQGYTLVNVAELLGVKAYRD